MVQKLPNGKLLVPRRAETDGIVGLGMVEIGPDDPEFAAWEKWLRDNPQELVCRFLAG
jgi:hypothetical protein